MAAYIEGNIRDTIGAETIGASFALLLGGVCYQQAHRYFISFPTDRLWLKCLVSVISTLNIAHSAAILNVIYVWDIIQWGEVISPNSSPRGYSVCGSLSAMIISIVQLFYAYRIFIMTRSFIIPGCILIGSTAQFATHVTMAAYLLRHPHQTALYDIKVDAVTTMVSCTVVDLIITVTILSRLRRTRENPPEVENVVRKIALLSIHTNACAMVLATTTMIIFITYPSGWVNAAYFPCGKLYMVSFMAVLNARPTPNDMTTTQAITEQHSILFQENIPDDCRPSDPSSFVFVSMDELQPSSIVYLPGAKSFQT